MPLPTRKELAPYNSLDEQKACEHFLGKTLAQAEQIFRENSLYYQEDVFWMGPIGFCYYVEALIRYIQSPHARGDSDIVNCFACMLEFRLEHGGLQPIAPAAGMLGSSCAYVLEHWGEFEVDSDIYGDLRKRYVALLKVFAASALSNS